MAQAFVNLVSDVGPLNLVALAAALLLRRGR